MLAVKQFRRYLLASNRFELRIMTDHRGLTQLYRNADTSSRLWRWAQELAEFQYTIAWVPGSEQTAADALSRLSTWVAKTRDVLDSSNEHKESASAPAFFLSGVTAPAQCFIAPAIFIIDRLVTEHRVGTSIFYRVRWRGFPPSDDTIEPLKNLRADLTPAQLTSMRDDFRNRATAADDEALPMLPGTPGAPAPGAAASITMHAPPTSASISPTHATPSTSATTSNSPATSAKKATPTPSATATSAKKTTPSKKATPTPSATAPARASRTARARQPTTDAAADASDLDFDAASALHGRFRGATLDNLELLPQLQVDQVRAHQQRDAAVLSAPGCHLGPGGLIMKRYTPTTGPRRGHRLDTIVLPDSLVAIALTAAHDLSGHHGTPATLHHMQPRFSFQGLVTRTRAYVAQCPRCLRAKRDLRPTPLGAIPVFDFLASVGLDHAGPFTADADGNRHLAVFVDHATKWVVVIPTPSTKAEHSIHALIAFVQRHGLPQRLFSDRGAGFCSRVFRGLLKHASITQRQTTAYNPQGDGHAEAQVGNICTLIRMACERHPLHWGEAARWSAWSYNTSYNSTTGTTPYFAVHGREPRLLSDVVFNRADAADSLTLSQLITRVNDVARTTRASINKMHDKYIQRNADLKRTRAYAEGDRVWLHRVFPGRTRAGTDRKWFFPFRPEPYRITDLMPITHARIKPVDGGKSQIVHLRRLKPYRPQADAFDFSDLLPQSEPT